MLSARLTSLSSSTEMNSASLSTNRTISHGHATRSTFTFFLVIHFIDFAPGELLFRDYVEIIKRGYRIRLGPYTDFACILECVIRGLNLLLAIVVARDPGAYHFHPNLMPLTRCHSYM